jgi:hypothetical protein
MQYKPDGDYKNNIPTDEEIINQYAKCGGPPVTKESILAEHQPMGGPILTWEQFKSRHIKFGFMPVEEQMVKLKGTLEEGLTGEVIEELKKVISDEILEEEEERCSVCGELIGDSEHFHVDRPPLNIR